MVAIKLTLRLALALSAVVIAAGAQANPSYHTCSGDNNGGDPTCVGQTWHVSVVNQNNSSETAPSFTWASGSDPNVTVTATGYHSTYSINTSDFSAANLTVYKNTGDDHLALNTAGDSGSSGTHSIDNNSGYDFVVFGFSESITLSQVKMGWAPGDTDFSLFAWTPTDPNDVPPTGGFDVNDLIAMNTSGNGWTLIGSFDYDSYGPAGTALDLEAITASTPLVTGQPSRQKNVLDFSSSYWAISAVIGSVASQGAQYAKAGSLQTIGEASSIDKFKIAALSGCYTPDTHTNVPEPASFALALAGVAGMRWSRRRTR